MVLFLIKGMNYEDLTEIIDSTLLQITNSKEPYMFGTESEFFEIECFDSETGKRYFESEALMMLLEFRKNAQTS